MNDDYQEKSVIVAPFLFFCTGMIVLMAVYPIFWNTIAPYAGHRQYPVFMLFRWDLIKNNGAAMQVFGSFVLLLFGAAIYLVSYLNKIKNKGKLTSAGKEYGSARFSTKEELQTEFYNTTIIPEEKTKRLFEIWRYIKKQ